MRKQCDFKKHILKVFLLKMESYDNNFDLDNGPDPTTNADLAYNYLRQSTGEPVLSYGTDVPYGTSTTNLVQYLPADSRTVIIWNPLTMMFMLGINYGSYGGWYFEPTWYNFRSIYGSYRGYGGYRGFRNHINGIYGGYIRRNPRLDRSWRTSFNNRNGVSYRTRDIRSPTRSTMRSLSPTRSTMGSSPSIGTMRSSSPVGSSMRTSSPTRSSISPIRRSSISPIRRSTISPIRSSMGSSSPIRRSIISPTRNTMGSSSPIRSITGRSSRMGNSSVRNYSPIRSSSVRNYSPIRSGMPTPPRSFGNSSRSSYSGSRSGRRSR